jgi:hypothetical protein
LRLSFRRTELNTDRNCHLPARRLNIICLGEIQISRSERAILFEKVSASGRRIEMYLAEA